MATMTLTSSMRRRMRIQKLSYENGFRDAFKHVWCAHDYRGTWNTLEPPSHQHFDAWSESTCDSDDVAHCDDEACENLIGFKLDTTELTVAIKHAMDAYAEQQHMHDHSEHGRPEVSISRINHLPIDNFLELAAAAKRRVPHIPCVVRDTLLIATAPPLALCDRSTASSAALASIAAATKLCDVRATLSETINHERPKIVVAPQDVPVPDSDDELKIKAKPIYVPQAEREKNLEHLFRHLKWAAHPSSFWGAQLPAFAFGYWESEHGVCYIGVHKPTGCGFYEASIVGTDARLHGWLVRARKDDTCEFYTAFAQLRRVAKGSDPWHDFLCGTHEEVVGDIKVSYSRHGGLRTQIKKDDETNWEPQVHCKRQSE
eukprot:gnl/MRDRNA2_/MRDRNA2_98120_c0_seq1.p1 gnl/MRDRNA2_/MRDRNA2_98120_c0~~gnl/MRDRNA2_/MRDRNA2_98120_c0_seq1.p1  ORF type:complete len:373 (+),score=60.24 gnl/MRDRNA2_/MRDRNA2_98120_c0_seq1:240-1358(+)